MNPTDYTETCDQQALLQELRVQIRKSEKRIAALEKEVRDQKLELNRISGYKNHEVRWN